MSTQTLPLAVAGAYPELTTAPEVVELFSPDSGWTVLPPLTPSDQRRANLNRRRPAPLTRQISTDYARALGRTGVTGVALAIAPGRRADFTIAELTRR